MANGVPINTRQKARKQKEAFAGARWGFMMMLFLHFYTRSPRRFLVPAVRTVRTPTSRFYCREPERLHIATTFTLKPSFTAFFLGYYIFSVGAAIGVQDSRSNSSTYYYYFDSPFFFLYSSFSNFSQTNRPLSFFLGGSDHVPFLSP